jgi:hypothetical protein
LEVDDDNVLQELLANEKEVGLVAKNKYEKSSSRKNDVVKVSTFNQKDPITFAANNLILLKKLGMRRFFYFFLQNMIFGYF